MIFPRHYKTALRVFLSLCLIFAATASLALEVPGPLVETGWLAEHQGELVILDARKDASSYLGKALAPDEKPGLRGLTGHIPGAVSIPWKKLVAKGEERGAKLKGMLPEKQAFAELMQASGVNKDSAIVIAGKGENAKDQAFAARLYFTLKYFGHDNLALLDGGTAQWANEGRLLAHEAEQPARGNFAVTEAREDLLATTEDVEAAITRGDVQLVDCRTEDFYLGLNYKRGFVPPEYRGHLAGAVSLPFTVMANDSGPAKLFSPEDIRRVAEIKGVTLDAPTITYCNTGVAASLGWYVFHELMANEKTKLYDGSMHAWSKLGSEEQIISVTKPADEEISAPVDEELTVTLSPKRRLQSLVDERRDALRQRRRGTFDAVSGRRLFMPPRMLASADAAEEYHDLMRDLHREYRDAMRDHHEAFRSLYAPWSQGFHDWAEARHFAMQMDQLDREEYFYALRSSYLNEPWGAFIY